MNSTDRREQYLSTGLQTLDDQLKGGGFQPESLLALFADPDGHGQRLVWNLCADRPVVYFSVGHGGDSYKEQIAQVSNVPEDQVHITRIPATAADELGERIADVEMESMSRATLVIDAMNLVEKRGASAVEEVVDATRDVLSATGGLGILMGYSQPENPEARWLTEASADGVLRADRKIVSNDISAQLRIQRLPFGQEFDGADDIRTFSLTLSDDISLKTSRTYST